MNKRILQLIELLYWVFCVSLAVLSLASIFALAIGGTLVTVKVGLFVIGVLLFGIGAIGVRPAPAAPHKNKLFSPDGDSQARFEAWIQTLPPLSAHPLRFPDRIRRSWKLVATSFVVLAVSAFLELGLGVTAGG
jgi:hypothetical protein